MELAALLDDLHDPAAQPVHVPAGVLPYIVEADLIDVDDVHIDQQLILPQCHAVVHGPCLLGHRLGRLYRPPDPIGVHKLRSFLTLTCPCLV